MLTGQFAWPLHFNAATSPPPFGAGHPASDGAQAYEVPDPMSDTQHVSVAIAQFVVPHAIFVVSPPGPASGGSIPPSPPSAPLELPPSLFPLVPELEPDVVPDEDVAPDDEVPPLDDEAPASAGATMSLLTSSLPQAQTAIPPPIAAHPRSK